MDKGFLDVQQDQNGDIVGTHSIRKFCQHMLGGVDAP